MRCIKSVSLICVVCLLFTFLPCIAAFESDVTIVVSDVLNDEITISGSVPADTLVSVLILNPGKTVEDITSDADAVQFMGMALSNGGTFESKVYMNTGENAATNGGAFSVYVSFNNELVFSDTNFVFYSNAVKQGYIDILKSGTKDQIVAIENNGKTKIENIYQTYSLASHELFAQVNASDIANIIVSQTTRTSLSQTADVESFLVKTLVLNAFANGSEVLKDTNGGLKYSDIWANINQTVSPLYSDNFKNDLNAAGKKAVVDYMLSANYSGAQFGKPFEVFKEAMLFNLIVKNNSIGAGHIDDYILVHFKADYKAAGFDTDTFAKITSGEIMLDKCEQILICGATTLSGLKDEFNKIVKAEYVEKEDNDSSFPSTNIPASGGGGGGGGGAKPTPTPVPETPQQTPAPAETPNTAKTPFTDMNEASWAKDAVSYLYEKGIINGRSENEFAPSQFVTRAELVKMICVALNVADGEGDVLFADVNQADWFASYVTKAASAGIIKGDGGAFRPNADVTREDAAVIIYRALGLENGGEISFVDGGQISDYAKDAISSMVKNGYINGMGDGSFAPKNMLTRAQAAQLIYNVLSVGGDK